MAEFKATTIGVPCSHMWTTPAIYASRGRSESQLAHCVLLTHSLEEDYSEPYSTSLQSLLAMEVSMLSGSEIRVICDFLSSMLQMNPSDRMSAKDLLRHRWLDETKDKRNPCQCGGLSRTSPQYADQEQTFVKN